MNRRIVLVVLSSLGFAACGGSGKNNSSWSTATTATTPPPATAPAAPTQALASGKGVGPVDHVDVKALDNDELAASGEALFAEKCSACHKLAERYIGPALTGVTTRRQPEWILNMMMNPEKMIVEDPTAKALFAEYLAPMANQSLTREQAESILAYFLEYDEDAAEDTHDDAGSESASTHSSH